MLSADHKAKGEKITYNTDILKVDCSLYFHAYCLFHNNTSQSRAAVTWACDQKVADFESAGHKSSALEHRTEP